MSSTTRIVEIDAVATHDLRRRVLRVGTPSTSVEFSEDADPTTRHLGIERIVGDAPGPIIAVSTWIVRPHPEHPEQRALQLRGMATDPSPDCRGAGFGSQLLAFGVEDARQAGYDIVWANARTTALGFYRAHGFEVEEPEFVSADTGIPHHRILLRLD